MQALRACVLAAVLAAPALADTGWQIVWRGEFDGPANTLPDAAKWAYDLGGGGWGNHELESYTNSTENVRLDGNGHLVITARRSASGQITSTRLKTQGKYSTTYGKIEARMKIPRGQGI